MFQGKHTLPRSDSPSLSHTDLASMRLINVKAFLEREQTIVHRIRVDLRIKVFELYDGEATEYAILSHPTEVNKRSGAGLSEAINSMYRWCANLRVCYAYLHDVHGYSLYGMIKSIPSQVAGQSGLRVGGHYRRSSLTS